MSAVADDSTTHWLTEVDVMSQEQPQQRSRQAHCDSGRPSDGSTLRYSQHHWSSDGPIHNSSKHRWDDHTSRGDAQNQDYERVIYRSRPRCDEEMQVERQYMPVYQSQHHKTHDMDCCNSQTGQHQQPHPVTYTVMSQSGQQLIVQQDNDQQSRQLLCGSSYETNTQSYKHVLQHSSSPANDQHGLPVYRDVTQSEQIYPVMSHTDQRITTGSPRSAGVCLSNQVLTLLACPL